MASSPTLSYRKVGSIKNGCEASSVQLVTVFRGGEQLFAADVDSDDHADVKHDIEEGWAEQASQLLEDQWPRQRKCGNPTSYYRDKIISEASPFDNIFLPCSYLLIKTDQHCVGHGRLTDCFESAGGNAAAVTFLVIDDSSRGQKLGTMLMKLLEEEAKRLGYHYIYLWTTTAIGFYEKIGYEECHRVSLKRDCLKSLDASQVEGLEAILLRRNALNTPSQATETILLARNDEEDASTKDVWMRKRLVEHAGSEMIPHSERQQQMRAFLQEFDEAPFLRWKYVLQEVPWQPQIGPSCGLASLRMAREYFMSQRSVDHGEQTMHQLPSLLTEAQERGYTKDGEVFDANNLVKLAGDVCWIDCEMRSFQAVRPADILHELCLGGIWILPYDSNRRTKRPGCFEGKNAHYGILIGVLCGLDGSNSPQICEEPSGLAKFEEIEKNSDGSSVLAAASNLHSESCYLLVQHSLSSALSIASFQEFAASNAQLQSMDSYKFGAQHLDLKDRLLLCRGLQSRGLGAVSKADQSN